MKVVAWFVETVVFQSVDNSISITKCFVIDFYISNEEAIDEKCNSLFIMFKLGMKILTLIELWKSYNEMETY